MIRNQARKERETAPGRLVTGSLAVASSDNPAAHTRGRATPAARVVPPAQAAAALWATRLTPARLPGAAGLPVPGAGGPEPQPVRSCTRSREQDRRGGGAHRG